MRENIVLIPVWPTARKGTHTVCIDRIHRAGSSEEKGCQFFFSFSASFKEDFPHSFLFFIYMCQALISDTRTDICVDVDKSWFAEAMLLSQFCQSFCDNSSNRQKDRQTEIAKAEQQAISISGYFSLTLILWLVARSLFSLRRRRPKPE